MKVHPKGRRARILLSSVFGPYACDDEFGSRAINPMELYHNQVTRLQGPFSLRMFHRSWGIMMIQQNISAPCTVLDFPTREAFAKELREHDYDIVGISSIIVNVGKVAEMCRMAREIRPNATVIVGGHVTAIPGIEKMVDADHHVKGDGIRWMREYLGDDPEAPIKHPGIEAGFGQRFMGTTLLRYKSAPAATIIPSVGCPMGCNFCTTSAFFGGKGNMTNFYESGEELFNIMCQAERELNVQSFFVMDENFLLQRPRAMELHKRMQQHNKSWELFLFSSANAIQKYTMEELVSLGVSWIWLGLESPRSCYSKLNGTDTMALARKLRKHGIRLLGSTIVGLEHHTPDNIRDEIEYAVSHETDFHQFMLYTPVPGTPLYQQMESEGRMLDIDLADIHGQYKFNFKHAAIDRDESKKLLDWAFLRDFERNGPSVYRICRTTLEGWRRYHDHPEQRVRERFARDMSALKQAYGGVLWAMERQLRKTNESVSRSIRRLRMDLQLEFGMASRLASAFIGPLLLWTSRREAKRLEHGVTYEPPMFLERERWTAP